MKTPLLRCVILGLFLGLLGGKVAPVCAQETALAQPPVNPDSAAAIKLDYRLAALDQIIVDVVGEPQLNKELRISAGGTVTFPYVGEVKAAGQTAGQLENRLRTMLADGYLVDPQVIVTVKEYRKRFVTVIGEVNRQGPVEFLGEQPLNIVEAVGLAGGPTQLAKDRVQVTKRNGRVLEFSLSDLRRSAGREQIPPLAPGDIIWIPQSTF